MKSKHLMLEWTKGWKSESVSCSAVSDSVTPWTVAHQAPLRMEFFRQKYWSELPFSSPGDLSYPGIEPGSPALQADLYCLSHQRSPPPRIVNGLILCIWGCKWRGERYKQEKPYLVRSRNQKWELKVWSEEIRRRDVSLCIYFVLRDFLL